MLEPILDVLVLCPKSRRPGVKLEGKRKVVCGRYGAREGRRSLYLALITQGRISSTGPWPLLFQPLHYDVARKAKKLPPGMVPENFPPSTFAVWLLNFFGRVFFSSFISRNSLLWISWTCRKSAFSPLFSWPFSAIFEAVPREFMDHKARQMSDSVGSNCPFRDFAALLGSNNYGSETRERRKESWTYLLG